MQNQPVPANCTQKAGLTVKHRTEGGLCPYSIVESYWLLKLGAGMSFNG